MVYRIAKELRIWDVFQWLDDITFEQFAAWYRYYCCEPFGEERADLRAGQIASIIAEVNRDRSRKPEPFTAYDFVFYKTSNKRDTVSDPRRKPLTDVNDWNKIKNMFRTMAGGGRKSSPKVIDTRANQANQ